MTRHVRSHGLRSRAPRKSYKTLFEPTCARGCGRERTPVLSNYTDDVRGDHSDGSWPRPSRRSVRLPIVVRFFIVAPEVDVVDLAGLRTQKHILDTPEVLFREFTTSTLIRSSDLKEAASALTGTAPEIKWSRQLGMTPSAALALCRSTR